MSVANPVVETWDGTNRRIYLKQGVTAFHWIDDIYIEYRRERRLVENFRKFEPFMVASGNEPKGQGKATPRLLKLLLGTKVVPYDEASELYVTGEAITDNADVDATLFDISTLTNPVVINYAPPAAEVIVVDAIAERLDYNGVLYFDANNTEGTGQLHPVGTRANPVNNISDGIAIATTYDLSEVHTDSNITLDRDVEGWSVVGSFIDLVFTTEGFKIGGKIENMTIDGDFNDSHIHIKDCDITRALDVYGQITNSFHSGIIRISANQNLNMADCESGIPGLSSPEMDMKAGEDTTLSLRNYSGGLTVTNCDTIACVATLSFVDGGKPHFEPSNTAGLISLRGTGYEDDRSNGTTIDKTAWFNPTTSEQLIQSIKDILEGDVIPEPTVFKILHKLSKATLVEKTANVVNDLTQLTEPV